MSAEQPTVLPWHREAAKEINKALLRQNPTVSAIIASHDPHAETLRLLRDAYAAMVRWGYPDLGPLLARDIRAHLAAMKGTP